MHKFSVAALSGMLSAVSLAQPTSFTFQGQLKQAGIPLNGVVDVRFLLFTSDSGGSPIAGPLTFDGTSRPAVSVNNGLLSVELDFGTEALQQGGEWLQVEVRAPHSPSNVGAYTILNPRQHLTAAPFALSVPGVAATEAGIEVEGDIHTPGEVTASAFSSNSPLIFKVNPGNVECARIEDETCYLGLGTVNPTARLHLGGTPGVDGIRFPDGSLQTTAAGLGGGDGFWSPSGTNIFNNNGGNVGVGTSNPSESFHLVGNPLRQVVARFDNPGAGTGGAWLTLAHTPTNREWSFGPNSSDGAFDFFNTFSFISVMRISRTGDIQASGNITLSTGANPTLFTGTGAFEFNRYLQLINTAQVPSASGLKAGGVLVADSYAYANPAKNDLIVKGVAGIGTPSPIRRLHAVDGSVFSARLETWNATAAVAEFRSASSNNTWEYGVTGSAPPFGLGAGDMYLYRQGNGVPGLSISRDNFTARLGCADFFLGHPTRRGAPGRALVDFGDHLVINFGTDWPYTFVHGRLRTSVLEVIGADVAEKFPSSEKEVEPGTVMEIDPERPGELRIARTAYNSRVAGVVSGAGDLPAGAVLGHTPENEDSPAIALTGRVWVRCDASAGTIKPGDLLTTSDTAGHAMKAVDRDRSHGAVLGKAMTPLERGERGLVLVLVNLQ